MHKAKKIGKKISAKLKQIYREKRPWGDFVRYTKGQLSTVKIIIVKPGEELSYQYHNFRDELWVPLTKGLEFVVDDKVVRPRLFEEFFLPRKTKHRVRGVGKEKAFWLEISFGDFDENDVVRLDDKYGRK